MITHNEEIAQMADRIIHIEDGKLLIESGKPMALNSNSNNHFIKTCTKKSKRKSLSKYLYFSYNHYFYNPNDLSTCFKFLTILYRFQQCR